MKIVFKNFLNQYYITLNEVIKNGWKNIEDHEIKNYIEMPHLS